VSKTVETHRSVRRLIEVFGLFAMLGALGWQLDAIWAWVPIWFVQSWLLLAVPAALHESSHSHFVVGRTANRLVGAGIGLLLFFVTETYRTQHIVHHADTCGPRDPEGAPYRFSARWQYAGAFLGGGALYAAMLVGQSFAVAAGSTPDWLSSDGQRRRIRINVLAWMMYMAVLVTLTVIWTHAFVMLWLIPVALAILGTVPFVLIPEHYGATGAGPAVDNSRSCRSNRFVRFVYLNTNMHTAHHQQPAVAWYDLPQAATGEIADGWTHSGYLAFHRQLLSEIGRVPATAA
jgi:fatty acid desaturase